MGKSECEVCFNNNGINGDFIDCKIEGKIEIFESHCAALHLTKAGWELAAEEAMKNKEYLRAGLYMARAKEL